MNREEIKELIPHREPMLLVDEINLDGEYARATLHCARGRVVFTGAFPRQPGGCPAWVLCEIIAPGRGAAFEGRFDWQGAVFRRDEQGQIPPARAPGDRLDVTAKIIRHNGPFVMLKGEAYVGDKKAVEGEYTLP